MPEHDFRRNAPQAFPPTRESFCHDAYFERGQLRGSKWRAIGRRLAQSKSNRIQARALKMISPSITRLPAWTKSLATEGYYTWTERDVAALEATWPLGTRPREHDDARYRPRLCEKSLVFGRAGPKAGDASLAARFWA